MLFGIVAAQCVFDAIGRFAHESFVT
jgi:hypothetical protein